MVRRLEAGIRRACEWVARRLPVREIPRADGSLYLSRYTLVDLGQDRWRIYLHAIRTGDEDVELHDHPWGTSVSLILAGGYREERRMPREYAMGTGYVVEARDVRPFTFNRIDADTFHRVDLLNGVCWTLFFAGPVVQDWGFLDRVTNVFTPWREFIARKGLVPFAGPES